MWSVGYSFRERERDGEMERWYVMLWYGMVWYTRDGLIEDMID